MTISAPSSMKGPADASSNDVEHQQDTAIIGLSCRFGGDATDAARFWDLLCEGRGEHGVMLAV